MLDEWRRSLMRELDYRQEAHNLAAFREQLKNFAHIVVPAAICDYSTSRVLTMEYVPGTKITRLSPLARMELDGETLAEELFRAYLNQILVEGFFHADPHPGNVFITTDHRIAFLDLGMVGRIMPRLQEDLLQLLLAIAEGRGEEAAQIAIKIGEPRDGFDQFGIHSPHLDHHRSAEDDHCRTDAGRPPRSRGDAGRSRMSDSRPGGANDARQNAAQP